MASDGDATFLGQSTGGGGGRESPDRAQSILDQSSVSDNNSSLKDESLAPSSAGSRTASRATDAASEVRGNSCEVILLEWTFYRRYTIV